MMINVMSKLVVGPLVSVVEVSGVDWIGAGERVVDLCLLFLSSPEDLPLLVLVLETQLVPVEAFFIVDAALAAINEVCEFINVSSIVLLITLNQLIHFLMGLVQSLGCCLSPACLHFVLQFFLKHHHFVLSVGVLVIIVSSHVEPLVGKHLLSSRSLLWIPLEHRHQEIR